MARTATAAALLLAIGLAAPAAAAGKEPAPPAGTRVVAGRHFEVYVRRVEEKAGTAGHTVRVFEIVAVARTARHGAQRYRRRITTQDVDLLDARNWDVGDHDADGWDDLRYAIGLTSAGCRTWDAERWDPGRERFGLAPRMTRATDAAGKVVKSCIGR
jgi:hypothetical protein